MTKEEACKKARKFNRQDKGHEYFVIRRSKNYVIGKKKKIRIEASVVTTSYDVERVMRLRKKYYRTVCMEWKNEGLNMNVIANKYELSPSTVENWISRFKRHGMKIDEDFFLRSDEQAFNRHKERIEYVLKCVSDGLSNKIAAQQGGLTLKEYYYIKGRISMGAYDNVKEYRKLWDKHMS